VNNCISANKRSPTGIGMFDFRLRNRPRFDFRERTITIPASITVLTKDFISNAASAEFVTFEPASEIRRLEPGTFGGFHSLKYSCMAVSVEFLDKNCFAEDRQFSGVETVTFEEGSKLRGDWMPCVCWVAIVNTAFHSGLGGKDERGKPSLL
jgi:hypothetical protein